MKITNVKMRLNNIDGKNTNSVAIAAITFDDVFVVHDIKLLIGKEGDLFVGFPSRKKDEEFVNIAHPITKECRDYITEEVVAKYHELLREETIQE